MEQRKTTVEVVARGNNQQPFDKRLIQEIVQLIEEGMPRRTAMEVYGMSKSTVNAWMSRYGSLEYNSNKKREYLSSEKRSVVRALESGMSTKEVQISFGLKDTQIIRRWVREFSQENSELSVSKPTIMSKKPKKASQKELEVLQQALSEAQLKIKALDTLIDIAEEQLHINIRKKSGARQS